MAVAPIVLAANSTKRDCLSPLRDQNASEVGRVRRDAWPQIVLRPKRQRGKQSVSSGKSRPTATPDDVNTNNAR
jgi:hypothetical protein